ECRNRCECSRRSLGFSFRYTRSMLRLIQKVCWKVLARIIRPLEYVHESAYMVVYCWYLRRRGMRLHGTPRYISPRCWFDGTDFSCISLGDRVVISADVVVLTHDYSL